MGSTAFRRSPRCVTTRTTLARARSNEKSSRLSSGIGGSLTLFKDRTVIQNIQGIASYVTKGGNEQLRYNTGFGRDLDDDLDAKMWRAGTGRADKGGETVSDERGLTVGEIAFLDDVWRNLMGRKRNKRGYLVRLG
jgi:hypothetical protein